MIIFRQRFPRQQEIMQVFGTTTFIVFGWSLGGFFYRFPSFILGHDLASIFGILGYMMAFALLESLLILGGLIFLCFLLPQKWFREGFAYKGSLTVLIAAIALLRLQDLMTIQEQLPTREFLLQSSALTLGIIVLSVLTVQFIQPLRKLLLEIVERLQIFVYIYVPLAVLGVLVVIGRNLK